MLAEKASGVQLASVQLVQTALAVKAPAAQFGLGQVSCAQAGGMFDLSCSEEDNAYTEIRQAWIWEAKLWLRLTAGSSRGSHCIWYMSARTAQKGLRAVRCGASYVVLQERRDYDTCKLL